MVTIPGSWYGKAAVAMAIAVKGLKRACRESCKSTEVCFVDLVK
jgi:hypothetical protein